MNATLAVEKANTIPGARLSPGLAFGRSSVALWRRAGRVSRRQRVVALSSLAVLLLVAVGITQGPRLTGYLGVFGFSIVSNAVLFLPSGRGAVMVGGALVLNPLAVAVLTGIGGALGEVTGYALGHSSRRLVKKSKVPTWLSRSAESHMVISILAVSIIPNPFVDVIGIIAGRIGYPLRLFLAYSIIGKVGQSIVFVYVALWNLSLLSAWIDLGG